MRTTLDVDEDVLLAAKEIAANRGTTAGRVLSDLSPRPTMAQVNRLRDEA